MPRGRHRHSPPLHRLLPPSAIAGVSVVCAAGSWLVSEPVLMRSLAVAAAAGAVVGSVVMRGWDRTAGRRVAELTRARANAEWLHEERIAELEGDLEESRELRTRLEAKLRAKRTELASLRGEHAALLRRYANAETQRASALEGRRQLALEAAAPARALPAGGRRHGLAPAAFTPARWPDESRTARPVGTPLPTPSLYLRANAALDQLARTARAAAPPPVPRVPAAREGEPRGNPQAADEHGRAAAATKPLGHYTVPTASAVVPPAPVRAPARTGGFDFFGGKAGQPASAAALEAVQNTDLADVVGEEALALHKAAAEADFRPATDAERGIGQVIDLTAHDETEQLDLTDLRSAVS